MLISQRPVLTEEPISEFRSRFVLEPLAEVAPNFVHPIKGLAVKALLKKLGDNKKVVPLYKFFLSQSSDGVLKTPIHERL